MKALNILQPITHLHITKTSPPPQTIPSLHHNRRDPPPSPRRTWRLHAGAKGFATTPKGKQPISRNKKNNNDDDDNDDKIPDAVWGRMISRILFYVGVPLATGFVFLLIFGVVKEQGLWDVPKWLPFLTSFITFGASALGTAYGTLSTSLDAEKEGSLLGFEQVEKNWGEMWKEEDETGNSQ